MTRRVGAGALIVFFVVLHLAFPPRSLEDIDSVNLALGVRDFDVARHQPHPPGYPVFVAAARMVSPLVPGELRALSVLSAIGGGLALLSMWRLFQLLTKATGSGESGAPLQGSSVLSAFMAAVLVSVCPLFWLTGVRPLSDMVGLAVALAVQTLILSSRTISSLVISAGLAGLAGGVRSQVAWLVVPLLAYASVCARAIPASRGRATVAVLSGLVAGVLAWLVPVMFDTGGAWVYLRLLINQASEDLSGVSMIATAPTIRHAVDGLRNMVVAPWGSSAIATVVLVLAGAGALRMYRQNRGGLVTLLVAFGPYFLFCFLFQETATIRYSLPLVVPAGYLALLGLLTVPRSAAVTAWAALTLWCVVGDVQTLVAYSSAEAPAYRMLGEMARAASSSEDTPVRPVLAMHRRDELELRRAIEWTGDRMPRLAGRLSAPPKHEWLELVRYWNDGGRGPVWFVADPPRSDLALVGISRPPQRYRWPFDARFVLGGIRPGEMDWYRIDGPDWYLGEGWALTPETAGVAREDHRGPGEGGATGWVRRWPGPVNLVIGGRNLTSGSSIGVRIAVDGRPLDELRVDPGPFLRIYSTTFPPVPGDFATVTITSEGRDVAIEQFDAQPNDRLVFGFGEGFHEMEVNPAAGLLWRWSSDRAVLHVRPGAHAARLFLRGDLEAASSSRVTVRAGDTEVAAFDVHRTFTASTIIPAALLAGPEPTIVIESSAWYVPAERRRSSADRRRLGLKLRECRLTPVS